MTIILSGCRTSSVPGGRVSTGVTLDRSGRIKRVHDLHLNSLAQQFANNREQRGKGEMTDRPPDSDKYAEYTDSPSASGPAWRMAMPSSDQHEQESGVWEQDSPDSNFPEEADPKSDFRAEQDITHGKGGNIGDPNPPVAVPALEKQADQKPGTEGLGRIFIHGGELSSEWGTVGITHPQASLREMYGRKVAERGESPSSQEQIAGRFVEQMGCPGEVARDLATLTLYDVAILISMFQCYCSFLGLVLLTVGWMDR